jgi:hypothetical protein
MMRQRPTLLSILTVCFALSAYGFTDRSANNNRVLFAYLDKISEAVGYETFESISFEYMHSLARQIGQLDRLNLPPEVFIAYVQEAVAVKDHFKQASGGSDAHFIKYVLPLRIRYESTARPNWRPIFREAFATEATLPSAQAAAEAILQKISDRTTVESESTYQLNYRGDLDPIVTWNGKHGDEIDTAILACAALRSVGIGARLAFTPYIRETKGGKVWLEYMIEGETWEVWVPSMAESQPQAKHRAALIQLLQNRTGVIFAHPAEPFEITNNYVKTEPVAFEPNPDSEYEAQYDLAFFSGGLLRSTRGLNMIGKRPTDSERAIASSNYWKFQVQVDKQGVRNTKVKAIKGNNVVKPTE